MTVLAWTVLIVTVLHFISSLVTGKALKQRYPEIDAELFRQHHEKCVMLGLIALVIINR